MLRSEWTVSIGGHYQGSCKAKVSSLGRVSPKGTTSPNVKSKVVIKIFLLLLLQLLGSSPMCDDNPHENISKIYKEEFTRLMQVSNPNSWKVGLLRWSVQLAHDREVPGSILF